MKRPTPVLRFPRTIAIPTAGNCTGIPATAKGYVINATAVPAGTPMPFLTLYPTGQPRPNASALNAFEGSVIEVHISNVHKRETFRHHSYISLRADGVNAGCGTDGYLLALRRVVSLLAG